MDSSLDRGGLTINKKLIGELIGLARTTDGNEHLINPDATAVILKALQASCPLSEAELEQLLREIDGEKRKMVPNCYACASPCGKNNPFDMELLNQEEPGIRDLKFVMIDTLQRFARTLDVTDKNSVSILYQSLVLIGIEGQSVEILQKYRSQLIQS